MGDWVGGVLCLYPLEQRGAVSVEGNVCCLWGMLSVAAPCWSWWGGKRR